MELVPDILVCKWYTEVEVLEDSGNFSLTFSDDNFICHFSDDTLCDVSLC